MVSLQHEISDSYSSLSISACHVPIGGFYIIIMHPQMVEGIRQACTLLALNTFGLPNVTRTDRMNDHEHTTLGHTWTDTIVVKYTSLTYQIQLRAMMYDDDQV